MHLGIATPKIGSAPPSEFLLFSYGANPTTQGTVYLTKESGNKIIENFVKYGNVLTFNVEHRESPDGTPGHFKLELRKEGLWATMIQWTKKFAKKIKEGDYLYVSPELSINNKNEIVKVSRVALTNFPATKFLRPLLLSQTAGQGSKTNILKCMLMAMQEALQHGQSMLAEGGMMDESEKTMIGEQVEALAGGCTAVMASLDKMGETPSDKEIQEELDEQSVYSDDEIEVEDIEDETVDEMSAKKGKKMEKKLSQSQHSLKKIIEIVGASDEEEAIGIILSMKMNEDQLKKKLSQAKHSELEVIVDKAISENKIPKAQRALFLSQSKKTVMAAISRISGDEEVLVSGEKVTELAPVGGLTRDAEMALRKIIGA